MRIRSIKPEFWRSDDIAALDWDDRLLFIGLWSYVDDNGVGRDEERIITADLFALDASFSESSVRVHDGLMRLHAAHLIERYTVNGRPYLHITTWDRHQRINRPSPGRYPLPDAENAVIHDILTEDSVSPHDILSAGTGEQGNRGTGEQNNPLTPLQGESENDSQLVPVDEPSHDITISSDDDASYSPVFEAFWQAYPRKAAKRTAWEAFRRAQRKTSGQLLVGYAQRYAADPNRSDRFTPHPARWLDEERWNDGPLPPRVENRAQAQWDADAEVYRQLKDEEEAGHAVTI